MIDFNDLLQQLRESFWITEASLDQAPRQQGAYVLWLVDNPLLCLKVGIAGPRRGKGLWGRLKLHFLNNPDNTVLARHMAVDIEFGQAQGYDFLDRLRRQQFLADKCFFQAISLPNWSKEELLRFEKFLELQLTPKYRGKIDD